MARKRDACWVLQQFKTDVQEHRIEVLLDSGLYRHIRFQRPGTRCYSFDLITWPGYLCYTGDMGTFVFSRIPDMFEFFRRSGAYEPFSMDMQYWAEKCGAADKTDGLARFSPEALKEYAEEHVKEWLAEHFPGPEPDEDEDPRTNDVPAQEDLDVLNAGLRDAIESAECGDRQNAGQKLLDLKYPGRGHVFPDPFDFPDLEQYSQRFMWCCYALEWGIKQYDRTKEGGQC